MTSNFKSVAVSRIREQLASSGNVLRWRRQLRIVTRYFFHDHLGHRSRFATHNTINDQSIADSQLKRLPDTLVFEGVLPLYAALEQLIALLVHT